MSELIAGINPTRMELIKLRRKIKLAKKGHRLLKEKRDALIVKFLEIIKEGANIRERVEGHFTMSYKTLIKAQAIMGTLEVKSSAMAVRAIPDVELEEKNIIGVRIPKLKMADEGRNITNRGYSPIMTSVTLDEAAKNFEEALKKVIELAEIEKTIKMLAEEVEKTKRRVNALDYILIPRMDNTARFIEMRLEEMEREDFSRLKKIKSKIGG